MRAEAPLRLVKQPSFGEASPLPHEVLSKNQIATVERTGTGTIVKDFVSTKPEQREQDVTREAAMLKSLGELGVAPKLISWRGGRSVRREGSTFIIKAETPQIVMEDAGISARDYIARITDPKERALAVANIGIEAAGKLTLMQENVDWAEDILHEAVATNKKPLAGEDVPRQRAEKIVYREPETFMVRVNRQPGEPMEPRHSLIHRNITPDNILMGDNGEVLFCGVGNAVNLNEANMKHHSEFRAAPAYLPHERNPQNNPTDWADYSPKGDVYSLAKTLQTLLGESDDPSIAYLHLQLEQALSDNPLTRPTAEVFQAMLLTSCADIFVGREQERILLAEAKAIVIPIQAERKPKKLRRAVAAAATFVALWAAPSAEQQTPEIAPHQPAVTIFNEPATHSTTLTENSFMIARTQAVKEEVKSETQTASESEPPPTAELTGHPRQRILDIFRHPRTTTAKP